MISNLIISQHMYLIKPTGLIKRFLYVSIYGQSLILKLRNMSNIHYCIQADINKCNKLQFIHTGLCENQK